MERKSPSEFVWKKPQRSSLNGFATLPARIANDPISRERVFKRSRLRSLGDLSKLRPPSSLSPRRPPFSLQGLDHGCHEPKDFYHPTVRDFSKEDPCPSGGQLDRIHRPPIIEPINMVTVWKGLTLSDCENLLSIQTIVNDCLEKLLEDQVILLQDRFLNGWRRNSNKSCAAADCTNASISHRFLFDRSQLLAAVSRALNASADPTRWDNSRSMRELLVLYLWSRDSLLYLPNGDSGRSAIDVCLKLSADHTGRSAPFSTLEAARISDYLAFEKMDFSPQEGTKIVIKPHYRTKAPRGPGEPYMQVTYTLVSNYSWLHWDYEAEAFMGSLPYFSHQSCRVDYQSSRTQMHLLRIHITALVVVAYPNTEIRLERTIGTRLTLRVIPTPAVSSPWSFSPDPSTVRCGSENQVVSEVSLKRQGLDQASEDSWNTHHDEVKTDPELREANSPKHLKQGTGIGKDLYEKNTCATAKTIVGRDALHHEASCPGQGTSQLPDAEGKSEPQSRSVKKPVLQGGRHSNYPGISLQAQAQMHKSTPGYEFSPPESTTSDNESRSETTTERENRLDDEAEKFEMQFRLHNPRMRRAAKHTLRATLPFRPRMLPEQMTTVPLSDRSPPDGPSAGESASVSKYLLDISPTTLASDDDTKKTTMKPKKRGKKWGKSNKKSSVRRRRDRALKESPFTAESMLVRDYSHHSADPMQATTDGQSPEYPETPTKSGRSFQSTDPSDDIKLPVDLEVHRTKIDPWFKELGQPSVPGGVPWQPIKFFNSFAPLQSLKGSENSHSTSSKSDRGFFNVRISSVAASSTDDSIIAKNVRTRTMPARGSNRTSEDTAAGSRTLVQSSKNSSRTMKSSNADDELNTKSWKVDRSSFLRPASSSPMMEPVSIDPGPIDTCPMHLNHRELAQGILRTPSPRSEEIDAFATGERAVISELLRSPDARQAFMQPLLSNDERAHMFKAMKRSLFDEHTRGIDPVTEGQETYDALLWSDDMRGAMSEDSLDSL
ncbi:MAG: hypothetical protein LQ352_001828 [Teloschistes flavicans]|nr:MAG: hypothetical protein LQ352_001828 [Teloschistes flavicans]